MHQVLVATTPGQEHEVGPYTVRFVGVDPVAGPNWTAIEGQLAVTRGDGEPFGLMPQARMFASPPTETNEAAIATSWDGQLYTVLGNSDAQGRWQLRLWWKPFVTLIWYGAIVIALGGLLSILGHLRASARAHKIRKEVARRRAEKERRAAA